MASVNRRRRLSYAQLAKLAASDAVSYDSFGNSVAIAGGTVVVGAHHDDDDGSESGSAYVFRTSDGGATYVEVAKLTASDAASDDRFGVSVAIAGDTVVIGATGDDDGGSDSGSAYVFHTTDGGATYGQVAKLTAADGAAYDNFGIPVAIAGDTVVVGAYFDKIGGGNGHIYYSHGSAYVFRTTDGGATYDQVAKLTAADAAWGDQFGRSVAIDGATVVVGARSDDDASGCTDTYCNSGSAYVFRTTDGGATYGQVAKLTAADARSSPFPNPGSIRIGGFERRLDAIAPAFGGGGGLAEAAVCTAAVSSDLQTDSDGIRI